MTEHGGKWNIKFSIPNLIAWVYTRVKTVAVSGNGYKITHPIESLNENHGVRGTPTLSTTRVTHGDDTKEVWSRI